MAPKKDPNKPKGRTSAYGFFMQTKRELYRQQDKEVEFTPFSKECAGEWKKMEDEDREKYVEMAERDRERYDREMAEYIPSGDFDHQQGRRRRKKQDPNAPKRAMSGFLFFSQEKRPKVKEQTPNSTVGDIAKKLGAAWRVMTEDQKRPYEDKAKMDRQRYDEEMEVYRKQKFVKGAAGGHEEDSETED